MTIEGRDLDSPRLDPWGGVIVVLDAPQLDLADHGSVWMIWTVGYDPRDRWTVMVWVMPNGFDGQYLERFVWIPCWLAVGNLASPSAVVEW